MDHKNHTYNSTPMGRATDTPAEGQNKGYECPDKDANEKKSY